MTAVAQQLVEMSGRSALNSASGILDLVPSEPISLRSFRRGNHRTAFAPHANLPLGITARHDLSLAADIAAIRGFKYRRPHASGESASDGTMTDRTIWRSWTTTETEEYIRALSRVPHHRLEPEPERRFHADRAEDLLTERHRAPVFNTHGPRFPQALESTHTARRGPSGGVSGPSLPGDPSSTDYCVNYTMEGRGHVNASMPSTSPWPQLP